MSYKTIILSLAIPALFSCSWIRTEPKAVSGFQSKSLDLSCIKNVPAGLQDLFGGTYSTSEADQNKILETFGCIDRALEIFAGFTRGASPDSYSSRELQVFANRYLPENSPIGDLFIQSIFQLKRAIVGGAVNSLTKSEIKELQTKLSRFAGIIAPFAGHIEVLIKPGSAPARTRREASVALSRFVMEFSEILTNSPNPLDWKDLTLFIRELELFTDNGEASALSFVREQLPVFQYVKLLLVGGSESSIETAKWKPIFNSISHFYSALLLTSNTSDLLEQMSLEVESSEEEQTRAVVKLTGLLRALIRDQNLNSRATVLLISDRFAKALLLNSLIFPRSRGSLALRPFLGTASLRRLSGAIVDQILKLDREHLSLEALQTICDNLISLLEQASISNSPTPGATSFLSLQDVLEYTAELSPLLHSSKEQQIIRGALNTARGLIPLLIGKDADRLTPKDLRQLITKSLDFYAVWSGEAKVPFSEKIGASLEILNRNPAPLALGSSQLLKAIEDLSAFFPLTFPDSKINWEEIRSLVNRGLKLKSVLFQTTETSITRYELTQLGFLYEPFRKGENHGEALTALASLLQIRNFQSADLSDLTSAVDALLPPTRRTSAIGLTPSMISHLKTLLLGGSPSTISRHEYPDLARMAGALYSSLEGRFKGDFSLGLDSITANLAATVLQSLIENRRGYILMTDLRALLWDLFRKWGLNPQEKVVDQFLIGLHTRILRKVKTSKPDSLNGLAFPASDLGVFLTLAEKIRDELQPLESLYRSMGSTNSTLPRDLLLGHLSGTDTRTVLRSILPLLNGPDHRLHFPPRGESNDRHSAFELAYKIVIHKAVSAIFPLYKVSGDPSGPSTIRLNETDLTDLLTDVNDLITELKLSYGYTPAAKSAKSRIRTINLFTRNGNGDDFIDAVETTEFLTITFGGKKILNEVETEIFSACFPERNNTDDISFIPVPCLSRTLFKKEQLRKFFETAVPEMTREISSWDAAALEEFRKSMLNSIDPRWVETGILDRTDLEALVSVPNYTENLFQRFDSNANSILEFSEAMRGFQIFCEEIRKTGGESLKGSCKPGESPDQIEAIYGYLLYRGVPPRGIRSTDSLWQRARAAKDILSWFSFWRKLNKDPEVRDSFPPKIDRKGILKIMSNLSTST
ncbi:MAG: hypothetical protein KGP28_09155 [Bdellovibrionales bacterium]|nr:hypothetical protein [Bdellovibrionales bacterium]